MSNVQVYYLDLQTLLSYLRGKSAILRAPLPVAKSREVRQGTLLLKQGTPFGCFLHSAAGLLLSQGENAYQALASCTKWEVSIETVQMVEQAAVALQQQTSAQASASPTSPLQKSGYIPRQMRSLDESLLEGLTAQQRILLRSVFALVNGERTVEQIKAKLDLPPSSVEEAIFFLRQQFVLK